MTVLDLKNYLANLPTEFDDFIVVNGEFGVETNNSEKMIYRQDKDIEVVLVDKEHKSLCILTATEENVGKLFEEEKINEPLSGDTK